MDLHAVTVGNRSDLWGDKVRTLERNKQKFYYCQYESSTKIYDEYGNETGEPSRTYSAPVAMKANISPATGQSNTEQFGNLESYDKVIVTDRMDCPINEQSVLFVDKEPSASDYNGEPLYDYIVRRVARSLNSISIAIRKVSVQ